MTTRAKVGIAKPKLCAFTIHGILVLHELKNYKHTLTAPVCKQVMQHKYDALLKNGT